MGSLYVYVFVCERETMGKNHKNRKRETNTQFNSMKIFYAVFSLRFAEPLPTVPCLCSGTVVILAEKANSEHSLPIIHSSIAQFPSCNLINESYNHNNNGNMQ